MSRALGSFTSTGTSDEVSGLARTNLITLSLGGTFVATIDLERSYDSGASWNVVESYTTAQEKNIESASRDFVYRLNCSAFTSGTVNYYLGQH